ncbi:MAG: helix-turn-helix transcriptional regulator [Lachnospiraceae bacterium]|nr:helix-turn-helix transcriptional regulator [Lachnospiraceae bacterium]
MTDKKRQKNSKSLVGQYWLLFFMNTFIPIFIVCLSLTIIFHALRDEIISSNLASTKLIQQTFDPKISELDNLSLILTEDISLSNYALKNNTTSAISTIDKLVSLQNSLNDIIIFTKDDSSMYSSIGKIKEADLIYQTFMNDLLAKGYTPQEWINKISTVTTPIFWPTNSLTNPPQNLYFFSPLYDRFQHDGAYSSRSFVMLIDQNFIHDLFRSSQTDMEENILLLNSDFEILSFLAPHATEHQILVICEQLKNFPQGIENGYFESESDVMVFVSHSTQTGFYYVRFLSEKTAYQSFYRILIQAVVILSLAIIIGIYLIFRGIKKTYFPLRTLSNYMLDKKQTQTETKNELEIFKQIYDNTLEENIVLSETINQSMQGIYDHLLTTLIKGNFSTQEAFLNACNNLGIQLNMQYYCVCSVIFEHSGLKNDDETNDLSHLLPVIKETLPDNLQFLIKDMTLSSKVIFLLNSNCPDFSFYHGAVANMKKCLSEYSDLTISIGMGSLVDSYELVSRSYIDSVNALDYRMIYGKNCLITPEIYKSQMLEIAYPTSDITLLYTTLLSRDTQNAFNVICNLSNYIKESGCSLHTAKYICYDIFSVLKKLPNFSSIGYSSNLSKHLDITLLINFDTIDDFFQNLFNIVQYISDNTTQPLEDTSSDINEQLVHYINEHCFEYDFQIQTMANHFGISPQHMRKLFKNSMHISLSDYISKLKLEKCMQLLRETDMNMNEIVVEIGNTDVSGFIRFFKKNTNMTPGEYRKCHQKIKASSEE